MVVPGDQGAQRLGHFVQWEVRRSEDVRWRGTDALGQRQQGGGEHEEIPARVAFILVQVGVYKHLQL